MKKIKRSLALLLVVLCICCFSGCDGGQNDAALDHTAWVFAQDHTRTGALSTEGFYYCALPGLLNYIDFSTGSNVVLCSQPGCDHKEEECDAYFSLLSTMFFWNDHLYYIDSDNYGTYLYRRNAAGAEDETVGQIGKKYTEDKKAVNVSEFAVTDGYFYYVAVVANSVRDDNGVYSLQDELHYIARIDLASGKEELFFEEAIDKYYESLILYAAQNDGALFLHLEGLDVEYGDPNFQQDMLSKRTMILKCWNGGNGETATLFEKTNAMCAGIFMVADGKVYFAVPQNSDAPDAGYTYAYDLQTEEEYLVCEDIPKYLGGGYALLIDEETKGWYIYDLRNDKKLPNELATEQIFITQMSDEGFILGWKTASETDPSGALEVRNYYVVYNALEDGLQVEDMQYLYTEKQGIF